MRNIKGIENLIKEFNKDEKKIVKKVARIVEKLLKDENTGHDYWHAIRVLNLSLIIAKEEDEHKDLKLDKLSLVVASLVHDLADWKFRRDINIRDLLFSAGIDEIKIKKIIEIINEISFKGALVKDRAKSLEAKILQDADRLDALGAIGIARCFATGAKLGKVIYNPEMAPKLHKSFTSYRTTKSTSINHFYEKLLLLRKRMNTKIAREIAREREKFMKYFLKKFFVELEAKDAKNIKNK